MRTRVILTGLLASIGLASGMAHAQSSATIKLNTTNTSAPAGVLNLVEQDMGNTTVVSQAGSSARSTAPPSGKTGQYLYFAVDPAFEGKPGAVSDLYVTVRYLDTGTDAFQLEYDATNPNNGMANGVAYDPANDDPTADIHRVAGTVGNLDKVFKTDTGKWLTHVFHLNDVYFGHRMEGMTDFRIDDNGDGPETISTVTVDKTNPIHLNIPFVSTSPVLDGKLTEPYWQTTDNQVLLCMGSQDVIHPTKWTGPTQFCGNYHYAWDNTALYVSADVVDDNPRANAQPCGSEWNGDGFEVFWGFDQTNPGRKTQIDGQDFHWFIAATPAGTPPSWAYQTGAQVLEMPNGDCSTGNNVAITDRTDGKMGYIMEVAIPWALMQSTTGGAHAAPKAGQLIGFTMFGNHSISPLPGMQEEALGWAGIPGPSGNPSAWLTIQLGGGALKGDLNGDGKVDIKDATLSLQFAVHLKTPDANQQIVGDLNGDGKLDVKDTTLILKAAVGL